MTISEVAENAGCSEATLVRLAKKLGYTGYPDLRKNILATEYEDVTDYVNANPLDSIESTVESVFNLCILHLQDSLQAIDCSKMQEAATIVSAANHLSFIAAGDAHFVATSAAQKFSRLGYHAMSSTDFDSQLLFLSQMDKNDVVFCISHSGQTKTVCEFAKIAHEAGIKVIAITNFPVSTLAKYSDLVLLTASFAYDMMDEIIAKRVPALCIMDVLYIYQLAHHDAEQHALSHITEFLAHNKLG